MSFTDEELKSFNENIESVYYEESITLNNIPDNNLFSKTIKMGLSMNVPYKMTAEKTKQFIKHEINYELERRYKSIIKGYKSEDMLK